MSATTIFFSYSRDDSVFVLKLAQELRDAGADAWLDQLDIKPGSRWDKSIENALDASKILLVVLSKTSVASHNVMDEVSYALEEGKKIVPVLLEECDIPFRIRRFHFADFTKSHENGISSLIDALGLEAKVVAKLTNQQNTPPKTESTSSQSAPVAEPNEKTKEVPAKTFKPEHEDLESGHSKEKESDNKVKENPKPVAENNQDQDNNDSPESKTSVKVPKKKAWKKKYILTSILLFNIFSILYYTVGGFLGFATYRYEYFFKIGFLSLKWSLPLLGVGFIVEKLFFRKAKNSLQKYGVALLILYNLLFIVWYLLMYSDLKGGSGGYIDLRFNYLSGDFILELFTLLLTAFIIGALISMVKKFILSKK